MVYKVKQRRVYHINWTANSPRKGNIVKENGMIPNTFQFPNILVDRLMPYLTSDEWKVLSFAIRQILGWEEERVARKASISLSVFVRGATIGSWSNEGVGLTKSTIIKCLRQLVAFGILKILDDKNSEGTVYGLVLNEGEIRWDDIYTRHNEKFARNSQRTSKIRLGKKNEVYEIDGGSMEQTERGLSDRPEEVYEIDPYKPTQTHTNPSIADARGNVMPLASKIFHAPTQSKKRKPPKPIEPEPFSAFYSDENLVRYLANAWAIYAKVYKDTTSEKQRAILLPEWLKKADDVLVKVDGLECQLTPGRVDEFFLWLKKQMESWLVRTPVKTPDTLVKYIIKFCNAEPERKLRPSDVFGDHLS